MIITLAIIASALTGPAAAPRTAPESTRTETPRAETRYCVKNERTGSRLEHKECHTRTEWLQRGFDPLSKD